jgi:hypothetical protein
LVLLAGAAHASGAARVHCMGPCACVHLQATGQLQRRARVRARTTAAAGPGAAGSRAAGRARASCRQRKSSAPSSPSHCAPVALMCVPLLCVPLLCVALLCVPLLCVALLCVPLLCVALLCVPLLCVAFVCVCGVGRGGLIRVRSRHAPRHAHRSLSDCPCAAQHPPTHPHARSHCARRRAAPSAPQSGRACCGAQRCAQTARRPAAASR